MLNALISVLAPRLCLACGADAGRAAPLCRACRAALRPERTVALGGFDCWAAFAYDGPAGALVRALKFGGRGGVAELMAAQVAACLPVGFGRGVVVPVPVHPAHRRRRGIDHASTLAAAVAARLGLELDACLVRSGDARPQLGRGRHERMRGPAGTIALRTGASGPRTALLVDDVVTTGATLRACADALGGARTAEIAAIAYARTTAR